MSNHHSRRDFLRHAAGWGSLASVPMAFNLSQVREASAQSTSTDYKALVCIFLAGGNDAHNTVLPTDSHSWDVYAATRDPALRTGSSTGNAAQSLALPRSSVLDIPNANKAGLNTGRTFGLHPQLKQIKSLYSSGKAAILANVGPLIAPMDKGDYVLNLVEKPRKLMSHNDQTSTWQTFQPEGSARGWGGLLMDQLYSQNTNKLLSAIAVGQPSVWLAGNAVLPYQLGSTAVYNMGGDSGAILGSSALYQAVRKVSGTADANDPFASDYAQVVSRALSSQGTLKATLPSALMAPWGTPSAGTQYNDPLLKYTTPLTGASIFNPLAAQLQMVARLIASRNNSAIGTRRQVFTVTLSGFDTHSNQMPTHADLLARLDHAVGYFYNLLGSMPDGLNMRSQVTTFTASEFGRALLSNGDGTDHGWGGHHFVIGDAVKGADVYGTYPLFLGTDGLGEFFSQDMIRGGSLVPTTALDQYVYTLGRWMGVADANLKAICPNLPNFDPATYNLGFMA